MSLFAKPVQNQPVPTAFQKDATQVSADAKATADSSTFNILPAAANSPLSRRFCLYFSLLSQFYIIAGIFVVGTMLYTATKYDSKMFIGLVSLILMYLSLYLQNRILYSMCANSLVE